MPRESRPGKVTAPVPIRKWGGGGKANGPSGDASPEFATTAIPIEGTDESAGYEGQYTEGQGALTGFSDDRGGIRKFLDTISGRQSTASQLNNTLALNRDALGADQTNALAIQGLRGQQGMAELVKKAELESQIADKNFNNNLTIHGLDQDAARNLMQDKQKFDLELQKIQNSNASDVEKARAANVLEAQRQGNLQALALKLNTTPDRLTNVLASGEAATNAANNAATLASQAAGARSGVDFSTAQRTQDLVGLKGENIPSVDVWNSVTGPLNKQTALNRNAMSMTVGKGQTGFVPSLGSTAGLILNPAHDADMDIAGRLIAGSARPASMVSDQSDAARDFTNRFYKSPLADPKIPLRPKGVSAATAAATAAPVQAAVGQDPNKSSGFFTVDRNNMDTAGKAIAYPAIKLFEKIADALHTAPASSPEYAEMLKNRKKREDWFFKQNSTAKPVAPEEEKTRRF